MSAACCRIVTPADRDDRRRAASASSEVMPVRSMSTPSALAMTSRERNASVMIALELLVGSVHARVGEDARSLGGEEGGEVLLLGSERALGVGIDVQRTQGPVVGNEGRRQDAGDSLFNGFGDECRPTGFLRQRRNEERLSFRGRGDARTFPALVLVAVHLEDGVVGGRDRSQLAVALE